MLEAASFYSAIALASVAFAVAIGVVVIGLLLAFQAWRSAEQRSMQLHQQIEGAIEQLLDLIDRRHVLLAQLSHECDLPQVPGRLLDELRRRREESAAIRDSHTHETISRRDLEVLAYHETRLCETVDVLRDCLRQKREDDAPRPDGERGPSGDRWPAAVAGLMRELAEVEARFSFAAQTYNDAITTRDEHECRFWAAFARRLPWTADPPNDRTFVDWEPEPSSVNGHGPPEGSEPNAK